MKIKELISTLQEIDAGYPNAEVQFDMVDEQDRENYDDPLIFDGALERAYGEMEKHEAWCVLRVRPMVYRL
jgi:hypothetical protein